MRCLYCGIRLKIAAKAQVIWHCPECSMRIEAEGARETLSRKLATRAKEAGRETELAARSRAVAASSFLHH